MRAARSHPFSRCFSPLPAIAKHGQPASLSARANSNARPSQGTFPIPAAETLRRSATPHAPAQGNRCQAKTKKSGDRLRHRRRIKGEIELGIAHIDKLASRSTEAAKVGSDDKEAACRCLNIIQGSRVEGERDFCPVVRGAHHLAGIKCAALEIGKRARSHGLIGLENRMERGNIEQGNGFRQIRADVTGGPPIGGLDHQGKRGGSRRAVKTGEIKYKRVIKDEAVASEDSSTARISLQDPIG